VRLFAEDALQSYESGGGHGREHLALLMVATNVIDDSLLYRAAGWGKENRKMRRFYIKKNRTLRQTLNW
jgi:hypothetical protein